MANRFNCWLACSLNTSLSHPSAAGLSISCHANGDKRGIISWLSCAMMGCCSDDVAPVMVVPSPFLPATESELRSRYTQIANMHANTNVIAKYPILLPTARLLTAGPSDECTGRRFLFTGHGHQVHPHRPRRFRSRLAQLGHCFATCCVQRCRTGHWRANRIDH